MTKKDAYDYGRDNGLAAVRYCEVHDSDIRAAGCDYHRKRACKECLTSAAFESEQNARQYSPFEFLAHEINSSGDRADDLWESYDEGVAVGIRKGLTKRLKQLNQ